MKTSLWKYLSIASAVGASVATAGAAQAQANNELLNQINSYSQDDIAQVNNVFQLSDVSPSDWAFDALRNLVEKYNCIVGYPDGTFRGNRPLSRYEFAAGLNACLQQIERMVQSGEPEVTAEDLAALRRLINEFEAELATLGARVDDLEGRVEFLEDNQFSTTTKLKGEVVFAVGDSFGDTNALDFSIAPSSVLVNILTDEETGNVGSDEDSDPLSDYADTLGVDVNDLAALLGLDADASYNLGELADAIAEVGVENVLASPDLADLVIAAGLVDITNNDDDSTEATFSDRVRLTLETSFTGKDTLITRLTAGNSSALSPVGGPFDGTGVQTFNLNNGNDVVIDWLAYYFPVGKANAYLAATGGLHSDYTSTTFGADGLEDFTGGSGSLTQLAASSPIYTIGGGSGLGINFPAGPVDISLGYMAESVSSNDPTEGNGLFNGEYSALAQIALNLGERAELGFTYVNSYHDGGPIYDFGGDAAVVGTAWANILPAIGRTEANTYGVQGKFNISDRVSLAAYGMYTDAKTIGFKSSDIYSYGVGVSFSDLGKEGNVLGLFAGVPPYVESGFLENAADETPFQVEGFYKYQLTDGISITPGVIWLTNSDEGAVDAEDTVIGTIRTTFTF